MVLHGFQFLNSVKISMIVQTLADELDSNQNMLFLNRTAVVNADDDEIIGQWKGAIYAADIIADDQEATTYESGELKFVTSSIPNIKIGASLGQKMINRLDRLQRNLGQANDLSFFTDWENTLAANLVEGTRQRINYLICAMQCDGLGYNRLGVNLSDVSWGMPADLKVTVATDWSDLVNSTPITDLQTVMVDTAPDVYGEQYNRITMSSRAFKYVTQGAEFQNRVKGELRYAFGTGQLNLKDTSAMRQLLSNILNAEIEVYDSTFWERSNNGTKTRSRVLPYNKVILSNTQDDNNRGAMDFANGVVTESIVGSALGMEGFSGESFGPISYWTGNPDLNPPEIKAWCITRGFPRRLRETCTSVLTVGSGSNWS